MDDAGLRDLCAYARQFTGINESNINLLKEAYPDVTEHLHEVTDTFYDNLQTIPKTRDFLAGRIEGLKTTHLAWLNELFNNNFDEEYTRKLYHIGDVHVKVKLPVEFMSGAMTIIHSEMLRLLKRVYAHDNDKMVAVASAFNAAVGFSLLIMQESYQSSSMAEELEKFLKISGMSRTLFNNLAKAYG